AHPEECRRNANRSNSENSKPHRHSLGRVGRRGKRSRQDTAYLVSAGFYPVAFPHTAAYLLPMKPIHIIGGGLAGSEAAWQVAQAGVPVILHEMRPVRGTDAHKTDGLAELVCSNSFRSDDAETNAVG